MAVHFKPVMNANYGVLALTPTKYSTIGGYPQITLYDMLGEQLHYSNPVKHRLLLRFTSKI